MDINRIRTKTNMSPNRSGGGGGGGRYNINKFADIFRVPVHVASFRISILLNHFVDFDRKLAQVHDMEKEKS